MPSRASIKRSLPPGPRTPSVVQALHYGVDPFDFFARARRRFGDIFTVRMMGLTWVVLADPASIQELFRQGPADVDSGVANLSLRPVLGTNNVLLMDGDAHLHRRRLVLPAFQGDALRTFQPVIADVADRELASWPTGRPIPLLPAMERITLEVILRVVFGVDEAERLQRFNTELQRLLAWTTSIRRSLLFMVLGPDRLTRLPAYRRHAGQANRALFAEIERRRASAELADGRDVLTQLLRARDEDGRPLDNQQLRDELVTLMVAGHQTMTATLAWAAHDLARAPGYQERIAAGEEGLALAVVREALRLHPVVPVAGIRQLRKPMEILGHHLAAGTTVTPCTALVHRDPALFPDPNGFVPERFLDGRPPSGLWFPFGGGARRCLGANLAEMEMSIILERLAKTCTLEAPRERPEGLWRRGVILIPRRRARVVARPRVVPEAVAVSDGRVERAAAIG